MFGIKLFKELKISKKILISSILLFAFVFGFAKHLNHTFDHNDVYLDTEINENGLVKLIWQMGSFNQAYFLIEKSENGITYHRIKQALYNSNKQSEFVHLDNIEWDKTHYYRAKIIDRYGEISYSNISAIRKTKSINCKNEIEGVLWKSEISKSDCDSLTISQQDILGNIIKTNVSTNTQEYSFEHNIDRNNLLMPYTIVLSKSAINKRTLNLD